jgi:hypothetical protein
MGPPALGVRQSGGKEVRVAEALSQLLELMKGFGIAAPPSFQIGNESLQRFDSVLPAAQNGCQMPDLTVAGAVSFGGPNLIDLVAQIFIDLEAVQGGRSELGQLAGQIFYVPGGALEG